VVQEATLFCEGKVKNDGVVTFVVTPSGGNASEIKVTLQKGMGQVDVCRDVSKEIGVALGPSYKVEENGGKVKVAGTKKDVKFSLALGSQTATGVTLEIKLKT
jgi:hypothetical protein